jgi:hypothetical protein
LLLRNSLYQFEHFAIFNSLGINRAGFHAPGLPQAGTFFYPVEFKLTQYPKRLFTNDSPSAG